MADVIRGAEKYQFGHHRPRQRERWQHVPGHRRGDRHGGDVRGNHMDVKAIVALTETGATTLWMSRLRSDIPIYAFSRNEATGRRVTMYRGVFSGDVRCGGLQHCGGSLQRHIRAPAGTGAGASGRSGDRDQGGAVGGAGWHQTPCRSSRSTSPDAPPASRRAGSDRGRCPRRLPGGRAAGARGAHAPQPQSLSHHCRNLGRRRVRQRAGLAGLSLASGPSRDWPRSGPTSASRRCSRSIPATCCSPARAGLPPWSQGVWWRRHRTPCSTIRRCGNC